MKKGGILNKKLCEVIASLGHTDTVVICDAGLPIPDENQRVDLALEQGIPGQIQVLRALLKEITVEKAILADEIRKVSPKMHEEILKVLGDIEVEYVPHSEFKKLTEKSKAIVRTGEFTPYANVILVCGCAF